MWFFYACCRCSMRSSLPGQPRSDISQNLCPATQCTHAAACSMRTAFLYLANPATQCTHAAACSMRTLCRGAKILRNITSRLARQKIWKNYACCTCSMRRKTTSLTVLPVHTLGLTQCNLTHWPAPPRKYQSGNIQNYQTSIKYRMSSMIPSIR